MDQPKLKLLIVDDDAGDRKSIRRCLKQSEFDCDCVEAATMDEALTAFRAGSIDCVILDYYLPGVDGLEGIAEMLRQDRFLPVIMSSGKGSEELAAEALKMGAMDYLSKANINESSLRRAVETAIEKCRTSEKLAESRLALRSFTKVLVHDIKTPIQSIMGFSKLVETFLRRDDFDVERVIGQVQKIRDSAHRLDVLIDTLHSYTEADVQPNVEAVPLNDAFEDVLANLDVTLYRTGAQVTRDDLPVVRGDRPQLVLLLQNLVANGIKYCRADVPKVHIGGQLEEDGRVKIEVRDNGIGIPEEHHSAIFEPFKRLHSHGEYDGTGLGLATCKKIVERHAGAIWCRSAPDGGSSFFFTLSLEEEPGRAAAVA